MTLLILVVATIINLFTIHWKISRKRGKDIVIEIFIIFILSYLFNGTITGMAIATSVSAVWSLYTIIFNPFKKKAT